MALELHQIAWDGLASLVEKIVAMKFMSESPFSMLSCGFVNDFVPFQAVHSFFSPNLQILTMRDQKWYEVACTTSVVFRTDIWIFLGIK